MNKVAIIVGCSRLDNFKNLMLKQMAVVSTAYDLYIGYDNKYSVPSPVPSVFKLVKLDYTELKLKFGNKINNFNGKWTDNPSKLGCIEWASRSNYDYVWYIEDDVYCKNWLIFFNSYLQVKSDIICGTAIGVLPGWTRNNWRVGSRSHCCSPPGISLASLMTVRFSKKCSNTIINEIRSELTTSHHELFIPYTINKNKLTVSNLTPFHARSIFLNGGKPPNFTRQAIDRVPEIIFHPVKNHIFYNIKNNKPKLMVNRRDDKDKTKTAPKSIPVAVPRKPASMVLTVVGPPKSLIVPIIPKRSKQINHSNLVQLKVRMPKLITK